MILAGFHCSNPRTGMVLCRITGAFVVLQTSPPCRILNITGWISLRAMNRLAEFFCMAVNQNCVKRNQYTSEFSVSAQPFWLFREMIYAIRCQTRYRTRWVRHKYYLRDRNAPAFDGIPTCSFDFSLQIKFLKSSSYTSSVN